MGPKSMLDPQFYFLFFDNYNKLETTQRSGVTRLAGPSHIKARQ